MGSSAFLYRKAYLNSALTVGEGRLPDPTGVHGSEKDQVRGHAFVVPLPGPGGDRI